MYYKSINRTLTRYVDNIQSWFLHWIVKYSESVTQIDNNIIIIHEYYSELPLRC